MAQQTQSGSGGMFMAFLAGGLLIIAVVVAFVMMGGAQPTRAVDVNVSVPRIETPSMPDVPKVSPPELPTPNIAPR